MARKEIDVTVPDGNWFERDKGKKFHICEMDSDAAEAWGMRALLALARGGAEIPDQVRNAGMAGVAEYGIRLFKGLTYEDAKPLLDEMFECITVRPDTNVEREIYPGDIEEVATRLFLREKVFELHTGFSPAAAHSQSKTTAAAAEGNSSNTRTSHARSGR